MVWAWIGMGLLAWSRASVERPGEGQAAGQHEAQFVQGQMPQQPPHGQVQSRPVQSEQATVAQAILAGVRPAPAGAGTEWAIDHLLRVRRLTSPQAVAMIRTPAARESQNH